LGKNTLSNFDRSLGACRSGSALGTEFSKSYTKFLDDYDVDLRYTEVPVYVGPLLAQGTDV